MKTHLTVVVMALFGAAALLEGPPGHASTPPRTSSPALIVAGRSDAAPPAVPSAAPPPAPAPDRPAPASAPTKAAATPESPAPADGSMPPGEDGAKRALESSSRHGEFVDVKMPGGKPAIRAWIVYPERREKAPVVIVIHEIFGLSDWIRAVADRLAEDGLIAVAPDLLSGKGPDGRGTDAYASRDDVVKAIRELKPEETAERLDAVREWAVKLPAANGRSATIGFCWGGAASFAYAASQPRLDAAVVYYGTPPDAGALPRIKAPVLGLYGADDARVTATVDATASDMKKLGKAYEHEIYEGAGHGFLRDQAGRGGANLDAARKAWPRMLGFLRKAMG